jgi:hypothetical protein
MLLTLALLAAAPIAQDAQPADKTKSEVRICRKVGNTGSRMDERRICKTKPEWASIDAANSGYGVDRKYTGEEERSKAH